MLPLELCALVCRALLVKKASHFSGGVLLYNSVLSTGENGHFSTRGECVVLHSRNALQVKKKNTHSAKACYLDSAVEYFILSDSVQCVVFLQPLFDNDLTSWQSHITTQLPNTCTFLHSLLHPPLPISSLSTSPLTLPTLLPSPPHPPIPTLLSHSCSSGGCDPFIGSKVYQLLQPRVVSRIM